MPRMLCLLCLANSYAFLKTHLPHAFFPNILGSPSLGSPSSHPSFYPFLLPQSWGCLYLAGPLNLGLLRALPSASLEWTEESSGSVYKLNEVRWVQAKVHVYTSHTLCLLHLEWDRGGTSHLDGIQGQFDYCTLLRGQALGFFSYHVVLDGWREGPGGQSRPHLRDLPVYGPHPCKTLTSWVVGLSFHHCVPGT